MAIRDILVLNTTQSRAETQQGSDTVLIKGGGEILSIENSSASPILTFQSSGSSTNLSGKISSTGNISGVVTGSFGKVEGTTLIGSAFELSNTDLPGTLSSSAQIASRVTGSFREGFEFTGTVSGSIGSTGSFDRIFATTIVGDANNLTNTPLDDTISGSEQIAADISGSFNLGFEFDGTISGSGTSTGSFTRVDAQKISGDGSLLTNYIKEGTISSSAQLSADISGSFNKGFEFTGTIKKGLGTWTATNAINYARTVAAGFGSQNASVLAGGNNNPVSPGAIACSETWNGTNWSEGNDLNQKRMGLGSAGTATAGLVFGGTASPANNQTVTETYDGTDYSEVNDLNTGRYALDGFGTQNSAIAAGGAVPNYNNLKALTEEWNGTNWSEVNDLPYNAWYFGAAGDSSESGIVFGGSYGVYGTATAKTSLWNGTNWSEVADMNTDRIYMGGQGSTNNAIGVGGLPGGTSGDFSTCTETWDGTSWSVEASMIVANRYGRVGGNGSGAIVAGLSQEASPYSNTNSELFEASFNTGSFGRVEATTLIGNVSNMTNQLKSGIISGSAQIASRISGSFNKGFNFDGAITSKPDAWTIGNNMSTQRSYGFASAGQNKNAALIFGGRYAPNNSFCTCTEEWNGTNWSEVNNMNLNKYSTTMGGGSSESALSTGGCTSPASSPYITNDTEYWNGTNWAECANLPTALRNASADGSTADIIVVGGYATHNTGDPKACNQQYSLAGNSWSEGTDAPQNVVGVDGTGTQNSFFIAYNYPSDSLEWNGTSWSTKSGKTNVTNQAEYGIAGNSDDAMTVGASTNVSANRTCTEMWNGFSWSVGESMLIGAQGYQAITGHSARSTVQFADAGGYSAHTQTFDAATDCINVNTLTANTLFGNGELLTNTVPDNAVSGSAQLAADISGSFNKGFEFTGTIGANADQWSVGPSMIYARSALASAGNSRDAVVVWGGRYGNTEAGTYNNGGQPFVEEWNGTNWSEVTDLPSNRREVFGAGTSESALSGDGQASPNTGVEYYNGSNWAEVASLITSQYRSVGIGDGGADGLLVVGGSPASSCFQKYDLSGNSWSELGDPINGVSQIGGTGTTDAAIIANYSPTPNAGQCWNGSTWSAFGSYTINRSGQSGIFGTQNDSIVMGGNNNSGNNRCCTEAWDGTAWSECNAAPAGIAAQNNLEGNSGNAGLSVGTSYSVTPGSTPPANISGTWEGVQLWNGGLVNSGSFGHLKAIEFVGSGSNITNLTYPTNTLSGSSGIASDISGSFNKGFEFDGTIEPELGSWSDGGALITARSQEGSVGTKAAHIATDSSGKTEIYNGSSWSEVNDMNSGRVQVELAGSYSSALAFGGFGYPMFNKNDSEEWNGTNWSVSTEMPISRSNHAAAGQINADSALAFGGTSNSSYPSPTDVDTVEWNGSTWTTYSETGFTPTYCRDGIGLGEVNAALYHGYITFNKTWDGSSWSSIANTTFGHARGAGGGTVNDALIFAGDGYWNTYSYLFDGTAWTQQGSMSNGRQYTDGGGTVAGNTMVVGGNPSSTNNCTEHFSLSQTTGSFTHLKATTFDGDASGLTNTDLQGTISASAQLAADISGSFNKGFEFEGEIRTAKGVWSTSGNLNTAKRSTTGAGTQNAGLAAGGQTSNSNNANVSDSEEYDGTSWTEGNNLINARRLMTGAGTQNAALFFGGWNTCTCTEEYNGTSYATAAALSQGGYVKIGFGIQNAAFSTAGTMSDYNGIRAESEQYDGAAWSNSISMIKPRMTGGAGSINAGITSYGFMDLSERAINCTELWNGTSWSETSEAVITGESAVQYGTQNAFTVTAGTDGAPGFLARATTQFFDGTAYSLDGDLNTAAYNRGGARTSQDSGLVFGGNNPTFLTATEEYNAYYTTGSFGRVEANDVHITNDSQLVVSCSLQIPVYASNSGIISSSAGQMWFNSTTKKLNFTQDVNTWSEVSNLNQARYLLGVVGDEVEALAAGGNIPTVTCTELWNGYSWSEVNDMIDGNAHYGMAGNACAAIYIQGYPFGTTKNQCWNGTNWSEVADGGYSASNKQGNGTANAAIFSGGHTPSNTAAVSKWDGTAFFDGPNMPTAKTDHAQAGVQNATYVFGGNAPSSPSTETVKYDGSSWATDVDLPQGVRTHSGSGTTNATLSAGGKEPSYTANTNEYNGVSWNAVNTLSSARGYAGMDGTQAGSIIAGGAPNGALSEIYTTTALATVEIDGV